LKNSINRPYELHKLQELYKLSALCFTFTYTVFCLRIICDCIKYLTDSI